MPRSDRYLPPIPLAVSRLLKFIAGEKAEKLYLKWMSLVNYAIVMFIAYYLYVGLLRAVRLMRLGWIGDAFAIGLTFYWCWSMSVGPFGWIWGFSEAKRSEGHP